MESREAERKTDRQISIYIGIYLCIFTHARPPLSHLGACPCFCAYRDSTQRIAPVQRAARSARQRAAPDLQEWRRRQWQSVTEMRAGEGTHA